MKLVITPRAQVQYDNQLRYGIARHGERTALRTFARVNEYLSNTIALFPLHCSLTLAAQSPNEVFTQGRFHGLRSSSSIVSTNGTMLSTSSDSTIMRKIVRVRAKSREERSAQG